VLLACLLASACAVRHALFSLQHHPPSHNLTSPQSHTPTTPNPTTHHHTTTGHGRRPPQQQHQHRKGHRPRMARHAARHSQRRRAGAYLHGRSRRCGIPRINQQPPHNPVLPSLCTFIFLKFHSYRLILFFYFLFYFFKYSITSMQVHLFSLKFHS
jgi:hypothetical protein